MVMLLAKAGVKGRQPATTETIPFIKEWAESDTPGGDAEEKVEARFLVTETAQRSFRHKLIGLFDPPQIHTYSVYVGTHTLKQIASESKPIIRGTNAVRQNTFVSDQTWLIQLHDEMEYKIMLSSVPPLNNSIIHAPSVHYNHRIFAA